MRSPPWHCYGLVCGPAVRRAKVAANHLAHSGRSLHRLADLDQLKVTALTVQPASSWAVTAAKKLPRATRSAASTKKLIIKDDVLIAPARGDTVDGSYYRCCATAKNVRGGDPLDVGCLANPTLTGHEGHNKRPPPCRMKRRKSRRNGANG
jgi:NAD(P)H-nitrite reductase large subunit